MDISLNWIDFIWSILYMYSSTGSFIGADSFHWAIFKKKGHLSFRGYRGARHVVEVLREM